MISSYWKVSTEQDDGLATNRCQAITLINDDKNLLTYASPELSDTKCC